MLHLFNENGTRIGILENCKNYHIVSTLTTGDESIFFDYPTNGIYADKLKLESYISTKNQMYVLKSKKIGDEYISCEGQLNIEDLFATVYKNEYLSPTETIDVQLSKILKDTSWKATYIYKPTKKRTIQAEEGSSKWKILQQIISTFIVEIKIDAINKMIYVHEKIGENSGSYAIKMLNLISVSKEEDTYNLFTKMMPIGKDGLGITGGSIENHQYTKKVISCVWKDDRYTDEKSLLEDAKAKLNGISKPYVSHVVEVKNLAAIDKKYAHLKFDLGDTIKIIDKSKKIREEHRIVRTDKYPNEKDKDVIEIANIRMSLFDLQNIQK